VTRLAAVGLALALAGCVQDGLQRDVPITWEPVDELNAMLPAGIRVFEGVNTIIPLHAWHVVIDVSAPDVVTHVVASDDASDNRETVSSFAADLGACVVVNGGYFTMVQTPAAHAGLLVSNEAVVAPATRSVTRDTTSYEIARAAIGFDPDGDVQVAWATSRGDTVYSWAVPPRNSPGQPAPPLDYEQADVWEVSSAVGAGPVLLRGGYVVVTTDEEVFFGSAIPDVHPRTAAGRTEDGRLVLMVVDGRQPASRGVSLEELASMLRDVGAVEALNLDGGGSSTLVVRGRLVNRPVGGSTEREVMSAVATFCGAPQREVLAPQDP
jgi:exopolysaccharide biosynthesis protein